MKYVEYKERCSNCFALVEGDHGEWVCDECEKNCEDVMECPEGLNVAEDLITEWCSFCNNEVLIPACGESACPICGKPILPCSMCDNDIVNCNKCVRGKG